MIRGVGKNTFIKQTFKIYSKILAVIVGVLSVLTVYAFMHSAGQNASAASGKDFNPGNIISDAVMANYNSMSVEEIQRFLTAKGNCNNTNHSLYQQLSAQYQNITWHFENGHFICLSEERFGDGLTVGGGQTAAEIIYQAAQDYKINPQVLIVLLEKEQGLITDSYPNSYNYQAATGYGCPDTAACDTKYYGFKNQVRNAAAMFRSVLDGGWSNYPAGRLNYVQYHPNRDCGGTNVLIENRATSALYRYTPYQPNQAALNAGYSKGDACSSYGNRNFYMYFTDWFGSPQLKVDGDIAVIPDGTYGLVSKNDSTKALDIAGASKQNGANIQLWDRNTSGAYRWKFKHQGDGIYTIQDERTGKYLSASEDSLQNGTNVIMNSASDCRSKWKIYETPDHYLTLESTCSAGMVLDNSGGGTWNGNNVQIWQAHQGDAEKWSIYAGKTLEPGVYTISSSNDDKKMIDIEGGANYNGNNIQIWDHNNAAAQKWRVEYNKAGDYYTLTNPETNKRLDLSGADPSIGTNIHLWEPVNACSQQWKLISAGDYYTLLSTCSPSRAVDLVGGYTGNTTNIRLWEVNNANAEKWKFHNQQTIADGKYEVYSKADKSYALDIVGGFNYDGVNVNLYESNHVPEAQVWTVRYNSSTGDYSLLNQSGNRSLDLAGGGTHLDNNIQLWSNNTACAQRWVLQKNNDNTYSFISACAHDRALDLVGGATFNANNIRLWETNDAAAQRWYFERKK